MENKMDNNKPVQIQLELPDYTYQYQQWLEKQKNTKEAEDTVVIIELY
jgi:hypothetical protein